MCMYILYVKNHKIEEPTEKQTTEKKQELIKRWDSERELFYETSYM